MKQRLYQYYLLMRMDRPIGTLLLLWPTFWALWIAAEGIPAISLVIIFALGVFIMRSAGCVINDYADRNIDQHIERTKNRPITSGQVSPDEALKLFATGIICAFILVLFLNTLTICYQEYGQTHKLSHQVDLQDQHEPIFQAMLKK